ncbi:MAG: recombination protein O N-terminal domain-containing protein [Patescibacteria group bacterium]|nr:recombination protein O N-terminal domain-containing protein [Patescibacteria group bacterium]
MHKIYITEGIVLGKRGAGEANSSVSLLTAELGLVRASARSARYEKSKLRYGLEPLTRGRFSLVRGKYEWKLTGVVEPQRLFSNSLVPMEGKQAVGRVTRLMLRLIQGEEPVPVLYKTVSEGFEFLVDAQNMRDAQAIECVLVLRILAHLGYLPERPELAPFVATSSADELFSLELTAQAARSRTLLIKAINESLTATGL